MILNFPHLHIKSVLLVAGWNITLFGSKLIQNSEWSRTEEGLKSIKWLKSNTYDYELIYDYCG